MSNGFDTNSQKLAFAESLLMSLRSQPFTGLNKSELEFKIFRAMVESGLVELKLPDFAIAVQLRISTRKVSALRYAYRIQSAGSISSSRELLDSVVLISVDEYENKVAVSIDDAFFKELITAQLRILGVAGDGSFNRSILIVDADKFLEVILNVSGEASEFLRNQVDSAIRRRRAKNFSAGLTIFLRDVASGSGLNLLSQFIN